VYTAVINHGLLENRDHILFVKIQERGLVNHNTRTITSLYCDHEIHWKTGSQ